jgi:hypothetical protein
MWTGRPGQEIYFRDVGGGQPPQIIQAHGVDPTVFQERAQRVEDMKTITGAIDILKGDRPDGITAASRLRCSTKSAWGNYSQSSTAEKRFVTGDQKKQLRIISKFYKEPRPDFIRLLQQKNKELSAESISNFIGTDLSTTAMSSWKQELTLLNFRLQRSRSLEKLHNRESSTSPIHETVLSTCSRWALRVLTLILDRTKSVQNWRTRSSTIFRTSLNKKPIVLQWDKTRSTFRRSREAHERAFVAGAASRNSAGLHAALDAASAGCAAEAACSPTCRRWPPGTSAARTTHMPAPMRKQPTGKGPTHRKVQATPFATDTIQRRRPRRGSMSKIKVYLGTMSMGLFAVLRHSPISL